MKRISLVLLSLGLLLSSCGKSTPPTPTPSPSPTLPALASPTPTRKVISTVTPVCISSKPGQQDVDRALTYTKETFSLVDWEQTYAVTDTTVAVTWQNIAHGALAYLEAQIKPCGYEEPDLNEEFSAGNWKSIFANYETYQPVAQCRNNTGLRLYQFKTSNMGLDYAVNYWARSDTDTRVLIIMLVFPIEHQTLMDEYAAKLFPNLSNCP